MPGWGGGDRFADGKQRLVQHIWVSPDLAEYLQGTAEGRQLPGAVRMSSRDGLGRELERSDCLGQRREVGCL
jgi:hypothetical protein